MSMTPQTQQLWEKQYQTQMEAPHEPKLKVRAKTQIVVEGIIRYMGEEFELPERYALGLVGEGEAEQVIEKDRPWDWAQNAPGPYEGDRGGELIEPVLGSREPPRQMDQQHERQQSSAEATTLGQPSQDTTRQRGEPGGSVKPMHSPPPRPTAKTPSPQQQAQMQPPQWRPPQPQHQPPQAKPPQQQHQQHQAGKAGGHQQQQQQPPKQER